MQKFAKLNVDLELVAPTDMDRLFDLEFDEDNYQARAGDQPSDNDEEEGSGSDDDEEDYDEEDDEDGISKF